MIKNASTLIVISVFFSWFAISGSYDICKDILREGVRDHLSTQSSIDSRLAKHSQFCSIAKSNHLSDNNFIGFARDYANSVNESSDQYDGSASFGIGPFSFGGNYGQTNLRGRLSTQDKVDLLSSKRRQIVEYYNQSCGSSGHEESLKSEAVLISKIASSDVVEAWRECMMGRNGFFAHVIASSLEEGDSAIEYDVIVSWRTTENTRIESVIMRYNESYVVSPYETISERNNYVKTTNICEYDGIMLENGSSIPLSVTHRDPSRSVNIKIIAKTNTESFKTHIVVLPKIQQRDLLELHLEENNHSSVFAIESYCGNKICQNYMKNIFVENQEISSDFVRNIDSLNRGTCEICRDPKTVRFCFENCRYKTKVKLAQTGTIIQSNMEISYRDKRYFYPHKKGRNAYSRIRIYTAPH